MGAVGSSADNALAESLNAILKRETSLAHPAGTPPPRLAARCSPGSPPLQHPPLALHRGQLSPITYGTGNNPIVLPDAAQTQIACPKIKGQDPVAPADPSDSRPDDRERGRPVEPAPTRAWDLAPIPPVDRKRREGPLRDSRGRPRPLRTTGVIPRQHSGDRYNGAPMRQPTCSPLGFAASRRYGDGLRYWRRSAHFPCSR
jgi:hypothetical protein